MRPARNRSLKSVLTPLAGIIAGSLLATLGTVSPAYATISGPSATNTATTVTYQFTYTGAPEHARTYIDTDRSAATGFAQNGVGADYLLENGSLYRHNGGGWSWTSVGAVTYSATGGVARWTVNRADLAETATPNDADLVFQVESPLETSAKYTHVYSGSSGSGQVNYVASNDNFANPERGFYHHTGDCDKNDFSAATLQGYRSSQGISLVMCVFYLAEYKNSAIGQSALDQLQQQLTTVRAAGLKMILRFAYTTSTAGDDAPLSRVHAHLDQLAPYLSSNNDVIAVMQAGFVGAWGEWYYTQNFGNAGVISATDWANRKAVVDKLLSVLPTDRMIQVRTPKLKRTMYSTSPVAAGQAYNGTTLSRVGHHNDCFLASPDDFGTYENTSVEYPYLQAETTYLAMGGETCASNPPRSDCPTAVSELGQFHWSYLNVDYEPTVLNAWSSGGCMADVTRRLGYRFTLQTGTFPATATRGGGLPVTINLRNDGFATPYNPRPAELVLRNTATGAIQRLALSTDPRRWTAGSTTTISQTLTVPTSLPTGTYTLLLNLPDPQLSNRPEYSVRFANQNTWEAATGMNSLLRTVTIS
ncbi:hypothetical protein Kfla_4441 [Kribbella flavida DSM 17836]|uniref:DUF4832 domain-containing protein n=1 Tax=Kribbella flavida (strain DSM 17836 / JCM 10339 / NBRC 14399) TaxID=479435 RepID=D2PWK3_KRIFD|nr:DUF4832 domain-containing protein [Kribbella flavida]ADB33472.1 hypothetical protein Kfla_4441 [Kribbella flavida DSM 17836]